VAQTLPFDRVEVTEKDGQRSILSAEQFLAASLYDRARWILERRLTFSLQGTPVDGRVALWALRQLARTD